MKNAFDAQNNFQEWIQNDWESDDYIEKSAQRRQAVKKAAKQPEPPQEGNGMPDALATILAILVYILTNPILVIIIVVLILVLMG